MGALSIIDRILGIVGFIERKLGKRLKDWSEWAAENPAAAAVQLDALAYQLRARAKTKRRQNGFAARRLRSRAEAFAKQADDFRRQAEILW